MNEWIQPIYLCLTESTSRIKHGLSPPLKKKISDSSLHAEQSSNVLGIRVPQAFMIPKVCSSWLFWILFAITCSIFQLTWITHMLYVPLWFLPPCPGSCCFPNSQYIISTCLSPTYHLKPNNHVIFSTELSLILPSGNCLPLSGLPQHLTCIFLMSLITLYQ